MSLNPTKLSDIILQVRQRSNMETSQFVTDSELTTEINKSLAQLDMILISKFDHYKLSASILSVNPGTNIITIPTNFVKLAGVDVWYNQTLSDGYYSLKENQFPFRNKRIWGVYTSFGVPQDLEYTLYDQQLQIIPFGVAGNYSYRVWFVPDYVPLVNTTDTLQTYMDTQAWHEYAVVDCCIKILAKQDLDASTFMAQKQQLQDMIIKLSTPNRNQGEPKSVLNTRSMYGNGHWFYGDWW